MKIFLILKSWQMFILLFGPMILPMFILGDQDSFRWFSLLTLLWMLIIVGWLYSVGYAANRRLPENLKKNPIFYQLGFGVAVTYSVLIAFTGFPPGDMSTAPHSPSAWFIPLHLSSMVGMFYGLWFTAKQFATLRSNKKVKFLDYSGPFFLFWFCPIGVWFLQPKINEIFSNVGYNQSLNSTPNDGAN